MKILVVDDEIGLGSMMCRTLRALGHEAVLALHPEDALEMLDTSIDAVVSDIDMPGMSGVDLAREIRERQQEVPVAFCTGSDPARSTLDAAATLGKVLLKPWTVDDVHMLVDSFVERPCAHRALADRDASDERRPTVKMQAAPSLAEPEERRVIRLTVHSWDQIRRLCARQSEGPVFLPLRVSGLRVGQPITVRFALPDGFAVSVAGEVRAVTATAGDANEQTVELVGLDANLTARLAALADVPPGRANEVDTTDDASAEVEAWERELARGSQRMNVSDLLLSNTRLRAQIEGLARKMRPRGGTGHRS